MYARILSIYVLKVQALNSLKVNLVTTIFTSYSFFKTYNFFRDKKLSFNYI